MIKKTTVFILFSLLSLCLLFSCVSQENVSNTSGIYSEQDNSSSLVDSESTIDISTVSIDASEPSHESGDCSEAYESSNTENSDVPTENIEAIPILFLDTTDHRFNQAYVICAVNDNGLHTTHEFRYNEKHLLDHIDEQGLFVDTNIIDASRTVAFYDKSGKAFNTTCGKIRCYGEEIIAEVHVCAEIGGNIPTESKRFIGVYDGVDIFPETLKYSDNSVTVDLDCDGDNEVISWSFTKAEEYREDEGDYYYYSLEAIIDGKTVKVSDNYEWTPLKKSDYEIFIADIDMDGNFEIVEYVKVANTYNNVIIYDVNEKEAEMLHFYTISPEP